MLYYGIAQINEHKINIEYPHGFRAADAFWHPSLPRHIQDEGNYRYNPTYTAFGDDDIVGLYPPILAYSTALFSFVIDIDPYNLILFMLVLFTTAASLVMYYAIKRLNKYVALLSLPLIPFIFYKNFYVGFTWGQFGFVMGSIFLIAFFWSMTRLDLKYAFILVGLFLTGAALSHTSEFIIAFGFIIFYFVFQLLTKQFNKKEFITILKALALFLVISIHYLIIFRYTWVAFFGSEFRLGMVKASEWGAFTVARLSDFGWIFPIILIGIAVAFLIAFRKKKYMVPLVALYMLLIGFGNFILVHMAHRAFQTRYFWPLYLSLFFGLAIYYMMGYIHKYSLISASVISAIILFTFMFTVYEKNNPGGMMDPLLWQGFEWIRSNTQKDADIYFFYGDRYQQSSILFATERNSWKVNADDFVASAQNQSVKRVYSSYTNWLPK
jgi:hypothetical protein